MNSKSLYLLLAFFCIVESALALDTNASEFMQSGSWASQVNELGTLRFARAFTTEDDAVFAVDSVAGNCDQYKISVLGIMDEVYAEDQNVSAMAKIRVDSNAVFHLTALIQMERGDSLLAIEFMGDYSGLYEQLMTGTRVRMELAPPGEEKIYGGFDLNGSAGALRRADTLCRRLSVPSDDRSFFSNQPPARAPQKPDASFF